MPERIKNYLLVAKPGIIFGNLISAAAGFFLASKGRVAGAALLATLLGISLVVASGCVFNNCIDRKIDRKMIRTRNRALAKGIISLKIAVSYATILGIAGMALLCAATNLLAVAIVLAGLVIYVGVYSLYMKRNSVYGALIGSLAGATPPLAGYCAVTGRFDLGAVILLSIFSLWQMPHCYAIAVFRLDDYAAAAIPVLPVKQGTAAAKKHIAGYILAFMTATLMLTFGGYTGYRTFAVATVLGLSWMYMAWSGYKASDERLWAKQLFIFSILTIFILSVMMSIDFTAPGFVGTNEKAHVAGDVVRSAEEVNPVIRAFRKGGIEIVAVHNHMLDEQPRVFFLHYWGTGPAEKLAETVRAAFDQAKGPIE